MHSQGVVLLLSDSKITQSLVASMSSSFRSVRAVPSLAEVRVNIAKHRAQVVVLDMELAGFSEIRRLHHDFPEVCVVCTHRLADEEMWAAALDAGATDICPAADAQGILAAALRSTSHAGSTAA